MYHAAAPSPNALPLAPNLLPCRLATNRAGSDPPVPRFIRPCRVPHEARLPLDTFILNLGAFLIGLSKAGFGGGLGMVVTPLLVLFLPPREVVALMLPLLIAGDIATLCFYWRGWDRRNVLVLFPGAVLGIAIGMALMGRLPDDEFKLAIGVIALVLAGLQLARQRFASRAQAGKGRLWVGVGAGVATGTMSALAHLGGLIATLYLLPQQLGNRAFVATSTVIFFLINLTKVPAYAYGGLLTWQTLATDVWLIPSIVVGAFTGAALNKRIPARQFAYIVLLLVFLTGLKLVWDYLAA